MSPRRIRIIAALLVAWIGTVLDPTAFAQDAVPTNTLSPDGLYGVTVPKFEDYEALNDPFRDGPRNSLIDMKSDRLIGAIQTDVAFARMNEQEIVPPLWAKNDSMVLWRVDGKWGYETEMLIKLENGKIKWQLDILNSLQQAILKRTRKAVPEKYAGVKAQSAGDGSWFKDGFAIDCVLTDDTSPLKFPLLFRIFLTSNIKALDRLITVDSRMMAEMNRDGVIKVDDFYLGSDPPARDFIRASQLPK